MRDFDNVLERLRETTEEINELKEYFVNEYPEIFQVECGLEEVNQELERIVKHDKRRRRNTSNFNIDGTIHEL